MPALVMFHRDIRSNGRSGGWSSATGSKSKRHVKQRGQDAAGTGRRTLGDRQRRAVMPTCWASRSHSSSGRSRSSATIGRRPPGARCPADRPAARPRRRISRSPPGRTRSGINFTTTLAPGRVILFHSSESGFGGSDFQAAISWTARSHKGSIGSGRLQLVHSSLLTLIGRDVRERQGTDRTSEPNGRCGRSGAIDHVPIPVENDASTVADRRSVGPSQRHRPCVNPGCIQVNSRARPRPGGGRVGWHVWISPSSMVSLRKSRRRNSRRRSSRPNPGTPAGSTGSIGPRMAIPRRSPGRVTKSDAGTMSAISMSRGRSRWPGSSSKAAIRNHIKRDIDARLPAERMSRVHRPRRHERVPTHDRAWPPSGWGRARRVSGDAGSARNRDTHGTGRIGIESPGRPGRRRAWETAGPTGAGSLDEARPQDDDP